MRKGYKKSKVLGLVMLVSLFVSVAYAARYKMANGTWFTAPGQEYFEFYGDWQDFCDENNVVGYSE